MASNFKFKLLSQLSKKRDEGGFTLIELLVVVIIIGVLAAVALPNLLGQVGKARETEGKNGVGTINRSQQAYHFEKQTFATGTDFAQATNNLGVVVVSEYYTFTTAGTAGDSTQVATAINFTDDGVRNFAGSVEYDAGNYTSAVCISDAIGGTADAAAGACTDGSDLN